MKIKLSSPLFVLALASAFLFSGFAQASEMKRGAEKMWEFSMGSAAEFEEVADLIRQEMLTGEYQDVSDKDKQAIEADLARVSRILNKHDDLDRMNDRDQVELFNAQERVNARLLADYGNRVVCKREAKIGTRVKKRNCMTAREWASVQEMNEMTVRNMRAQAPFLMAEEP